MIMFQRTEQVARRRTFAGPITSPAVDHNWYRTVTKQSVPAR